MDSALSILILIVIAGVVVIGIAKAATRAHAESKALKQIEEHRRGRKAAEEAAIATGTWLEVKEAFPFVPTPVVDDYTPEAIYKAAGEVLAGYSTWGMIAGTPLPAPGLPPAERRRHLYVVGKTGSGKSTFLEHLIAEDLEGGRGVGVIGPEGEFFRNRLLGLVPESRRDDVIYFAPGNAGCPLTFNPLALEEGEDPVRAAEDLFTIFKRTLSQDELGARMQPIIQNAFAALVGRPGATLWDVKRLLDDVTYRKDLMADVPDEYVRDFWLETYPRYPKGADLPILNRLDQFLRPPVMRRTLCHPQSSFSIRTALAENRILLIDLYGLSEENRILFGQLVLSKIQLELMRRELGGAADIEPFHLYADEFQSFASMAEGTWRELLSRGRKYGLSLTLAHQFPAQLPVGLQDEILGNVNSIVAFALGGKDAQLLRREFLQKVLNGGAERLDPIAASGLMDLATGEAWAKLAGGRAVRLAIAAPLRGTDPDDAQDTINESWARHRPAEQVAGKVARAPGRSIGDDPAARDEFLE